MSPAGLSMLGSGIQAIGTLHEANTSASMQEYQAQGAETNANLAMAQSAEQERRARVEASKHLGQMRASYGASGVNLEGSPLDVLEESARTAELDALTIRGNGAQQAAGYRTQAQAARWSAGQTRIGGYISATSQLIGGAAKAKGMT